MIKTKTNKTFKTALLGGMSVVAFTAMAGYSGVALADAETLGGATTWASSGAPANGTQDGTTAAAGDAVELKGYALTITNNGTADDGSGDTNTFALGAVTDDDTNSGGAITVVSGSANDLGVTIASAVATTGNIAISNVDGHNATVTTTFTGAAEATAGNFTVTNNETDSNDDVNASVGGTLTVGGTTTITASDFAGASSSLTVTGAGAFTGAVSVVAGAGAGSDATLTLGDDVTFTADVDLNDGAAGKATLVFNGAAAQDVTGDITANADGEGAISVTNTAGAVTFDNIGTTGARVAVGSLTVASGAVADLGGDVYVDTITGKGSLNMSANNTVEVATDLGTSSQPVEISVDAGVATTLQSEAAGTIYSDITLDGAGSDITIGSGTIQTDLKGDIIAAADGEGLVTIESDGATATTVNGAIGTSTAKIDTLTGSANDGVNFKGKVYTETLTGAGGNMNFQETVTASTNITGGAGDLDFDKAVSAGTIVSGTGELNFDGAVTATGAVTGTGAGTFDFNSTVAAASFDLQAADATFAGNVTSTGNLDIDGQTATFDGTSAQTVSGVIIDTATGGTIDVQNKSGVTFSDTVTASNVTVGATYKATFSDVVTSDTLASLGGTSTFSAAANSLAAVTFASTSDVTFAENGNTVSGNLTMADGMKLTVGNAVANGEIVLDVTGGNVVDTTGMTITVNMPTTLADGDVITLVDSNNDADTGAGTWSAATNGLFSYTVDDTTNNDVTITVAKNSTSKIASTLGVTAQTAGALDSANTALATGDATALTALAAALNAGGTTASNAAEQVGIQADTLGATTAAVMGTGAQVVGVAGSRLASLRSGAQYANAEATGFATGDAGMDKAMWVKPFGNWISQDEKDGIDGYDASTYGLAAGIDGQVNPNSRVGASIAYASTDVDGKGAGDSQSDIDSYQLTVYGDYTTDTYYLEGMVGYAMNSTDTERRITFGGLNRTALGDYDGNQFMVNIGGGMPMEMKENVFVTPMGGVQYTRVSSDSYTETGAGNLNMTVDPDDVDAFIASVGAKVHTKIQKGEGHLIPSAVLGVSYDFSGDEATATGTFTGGGAAFTVEGAEVEKLAGNIGLGLTYQDDAWSVGANYDAEIKSDYTGHSATLEARFKF